MGDQPALLELTGVKKTYRPAGTDVATEVLRGVDLRLSAGESLAIVGPSGCGKSTLLNIIGTLDRPTAGRVVLDGDDLAAKDDKALAVLRSRKIGFVFQLHHLLPQCTILENVLLPTLAAGDSRPIAEREAAAYKLLDRVGLSHRVDRRPGQLSGGEQQRAAVVRALINQPRLLLADEPTGSLDRASADTLADLLAELNREQDLTLIVVTHSQSLAERMHRRFTLRDGLLEKA
jgi:ABC-type lipoprotein export system ATPase subunit